MHHLWQASNTPYRTMFQCMPSCTVPKVAAIFEIVEQAKAKDKAIREALSENLNKSLSEAAEVLTKSLKDVNTTRDAVSKIGAAEK